MKAKLKKQNGITLVALVITIIVLLILATVSIKIIMDGGLITKAKSATDQHTIGAEKEAIQTGYAAYQIDLANKETAELKVKGANTTLNNNENEWDIEFDNGNKYIMLINGKIIKNTVPSEYSQCEYIENTGKAYIDTNLSLSENFKIIGEYAQTKVLNLEQPVVSIWTVQYNYWNLFVRIGDKRADIYTAKHNVMSKEFELNQKHNFEIIRNKSEWSLKIDEEVMNWKYEAKEINPTTLKLLARGDLNFTCYNRLYKVKVYDNSEIIGNFIPCIDTNNTPCMYDTVTGKTFYNNGQGEFIAGPVIE